jgi:hypothetical protein
LQIEQLSVEMTTLRDQLKQTTVKAQEAAAYKKLTADMEEQNHDLRSRLVDAEAAAKARESWLEDCVNSEWFNHSGAVIRFLLHVRPFTFSLVRLELAAAAADDRDASSVRMGRCITLRPTGSLEPWYYVLVWLKCLTVFIFSPKFTIR